VSRPAPVEHAPAPVGPGSPPWAPLRHRVFCALWLGQLASNIGTWMQVVGSQWLMGTLGGTPLQVSLVLAATTLPVFVVALPAGALGDIFDRRRILLWSQALMLMGSAGLAAITLAGAATPWLLLALTFVVGIGQGLSMPSWQAIQPELVERPEIPLAATLNGVNANLARAIGPAIGGAIVALAGAGWTFALNAASFLAVAAVLVAWRRPADVRGHDPEHVRAAVRSGVSYVRHSPRLRAVLARAALFVAFAGALWAVLPVLVRQHLGLDSGGYGMLLGAVGLGAVAGAFVIAGARRRLSTDDLVAAGSAAFAVAAALLAVVSWAPLVVLALVVVGAAWIAVLSSLSAWSQTVLPDWVRSRGLAAFLLVIQGGQAFSAIAIGFVTQLAGARVAFGVVAAGLAVGLGGTRRWPLLPGGDLDVFPHPTSDPEIVIDPDPRSGPILVTVEYRVLPADHSAFRERMLAVGRMRRRTGARRWALYQDGADPMRFVETFLVPTWQEHLRQNGERTTRADHAVTQRALEVAAASGQVPRVRHLFSSYWPDASQR
jgi:MFS family permease